MSPEEVAAFWERVDTSGDCWTWTGYRNRGGYGRFRGVGAHRVSFELHHRSLSPGETVDHLCFQPSCVNPSHLDACSLAENLARKKNRPSCRRGHDFTPENTYWDPRGNRECIACRRERQRRSWGGRMADPAKRSARQEYMHTYGIERRQAGAA